ncbi:Uncharacterised protein [Escherichia coli]|uniref:Uncharacterized protein n=1 Tax=Escherichia coli TaxID=562 RepID=A0A376VEH1_ECOLX|nr:Uncharacterised protein [Escherichia coli]
MTLNMRVTLGGVLQHGEVGEDKRVGTQLRRHIHGALPTGVTVRMRKSVKSRCEVCGDVDGQNSPLPAIFLGKVKAGEVTGIGIIF